VSSIAGQDQPSLKQLSSLDNLTDFYACQIKDIDVVSKFKKLQNLSLDSVKVANLDFLKGLKAVKKLYLRGSDAIKDFSGLSELPSLAEASFIRNYKIETVDFISALVNLERLYISDFSLIKSFPSFKNLNSVSDLTIVSCKSINDISALNEMDNLEQFSCHLGSKYISPEDLISLKNHKTLKRLYAGFASQKENDRFHKIFSGSKLLCKSWVF
jgi:Leucine-rich repeat (LRR) protein